VIAADVSGYLASAMRTHTTMRVLADAARPMEPTHTARDWILTMHFYVIVHYVNALAATRSKRFTNHGQRRTWVRDDPALAGIAVAYLTLDGWSREARYEGVLVDDFTDLHATFRRVRDHLVASLRTAGVERVPVLDPVDFE
jgi:hypothetical protein